MTTCPDCRATLSGNDPTCGACGAQLTVLDRPLAPGHDRSLALIELGVISALAFGPVIWRSTEVLLGPAGSVVLDDESLQSGIVTELSTLFAVGVILVLRGWKLADFRMPISGRLTGGGVLLIAVWWAVGLLLGAILPRSDTPWDGTGLSLSTAVAFSVVNGTWEELLLVGYAFRAAERLWSTRVAFVLSVGLRVSYHLYQGVSGALAIGVLGLLLGACYLRWRRLWPLVVVHIAADILGLWWVVGASSAG